jgi:nicotinamide/nicotinate riboside kinase
MTSSQDAVVVGLGGITNGGKTTMCRSLEHVFSSDKYNLRVKCLHIDDYYRPDNDPHHKHLEKFDHHDWDCLEAIDTDRFIEDFQSIRLTCDLLLVEGFLIFNVSSPSKNHPLFNLAYYFDLPYEECLKRRLERNYDPPDPHGYFEEHVWQAYIKAKKEAFETNKYIELELIDTTKESFEKLQDKIIKDIEKTLKRIQKLP